MTNSIQLLKEGCEKVGILVIRDACWRFYVGPQGRFGPEAQSSMLRRRLGDTQTVI